MKQLALYIFAVFFSYSQVDKGTLLLNPNFSFSAKNTKSKFISEAENDQKLFSVRSQTGYFINRHLVFGASLNFSYLSTRTKTEDFPVLGSNVIKGIESESSNSVFQIGPFLRFYQEISEGIQFYLHLEYVFTKITENSPDYSQMSTENKERTDDFEKFYAGPGLSFFFTEQSSIDLSLLYSYRSEELTSSIDQVESGFIARIGYSLYLSLD